MGGCKPCKKTLKDAIVKILLIYLQILSVLLLFMLVKRIY